MRTETSSVVHALQGVALFQGCSARELRWIDRTSTECHVDTGRVLCREGEVGREFFVIVGGEAEVSVAGVPVVRLGRGSFFGEMALLDSGTRAATVTATTPMELRVFTRREFMTMLREVPSMSQQVLCTLSSRLRLADRMLARSDTILV